MHARGGAAAGRVIGGDGASVTEASAGRGVPKLVLIVNHGS